MVVTGMQLQPQHHRKLLGVTRTHGIVKQADNEMGWLSAEAKKAHGTSSISEASRQTAAWAGRCGSGCKWRAASNQQLHSQQRHASVHAIKEKMMCVCVCKMSACHGSVAAATTMPLV